MYRKGTFFRGPDDTTNAEDTVRKIIKNNQKPFLSDIDNLRISIEDNDDLIIPPNIRALGTNLNQNSEITVFLVNECWEPDWKTRLSKSESAKIVDFLTKNMHSSSLVESLLDRMEDYSCHLEDLVEGNLQCLYENHMG